MKTDNYLTLCLDQANKSPLHFRHGCVIVRGGKVIGQGYNDYKPGFNGGALKHGRIANGSLDGPAMAELKRKLKKQKEKPEDHEPRARRRPRSTSPATPEIKLGGGPNANAALSMHSEMMAIHSALAASSTMSSTVSSREQPSFKLSRSDKRKSRQRREVLSHVVLNRTCGDEEAQLRNGEKRWQKNENENEKEGKKQKKHRGSPPARSGSPPHPLPFAAHESRKHTIDDLRTYDSKNYGRNEHASRTASKPVKQYIAGKQKRPTSATVQIPKTQASHTIMDRKKPTRLAGADLYVARFGWSRTTADALTPTTPHHPQTAKHPLPLLTASSPPSGSLHDELISRTPSPTPAHAAHHSCGGGGNPTLDPDLIRASRPCYRCISYMHSVGIKRVFWTNDDGDWDGGKVRDLVEALDKTMESMGLDGDGGGGAGQDRPTGKGLFVTKHEVLMLKRLMDEGAE